MRKRGIKELIAFQIISIMMVQILTTVTVMPAAAKTDYMALKSGDYYSLAIKDDGTVWAWGLNNYGQLGDGTTANRSAPVQVTGLTGVAAVAAGQCHSLAVKSDGTVWTWGYNEYAQLGDGTTANRSTPVQVTGLTGVAAVAGGQCHSLAIKDDGTVWAWGSNNHGQLGDGTSVNRTTPVQVTGLTGVVAVAAGYTHSLAIKDDGTAWAWGDNNNGQLGDGTTVNKNIPVQITGLAGVAAVAGGYSYSLAVKNDGTVYSWGLNNYGQLGDGTTTNRSTPVQAAGLTGVTTAAAGYNHSLAVKNDGTVYSWGLNNYGQLGDGTTTNRSAPVQAAGLTGVMTVAAGHNHSLALKNDGTVWAWGQNDYGKLGDGTTTQKTIPAQVIGLTGVMDAAAGYNHIVTLKNDGTVWAWGCNSNGQLGDGTTTNKNTPVQVTGLTGVTAVAAGGYHSLAIRNDGTVWAWGHNNYGQLGDGTTIQKNTPVQVTELTGVLAIAAGDFHSLALKNDGTVWAWGYNNYGQLGDGTSTNSSTPVQVIGLTGMTAVAAGGYHSLAVKNDGTVRAWGYNNYGQLGDGTSTNKNTPVQVTGLTGVLAAEAGSLHSLAIKNDGTAWAWGYNSSGQLGDGTTTNRSAPVQVTGLTGVTVVAAGGNHSLAVKNDGTVWTWGINNYGQLGDGTTTQKATPVQAAGLTGVITAAGGGYHSLAIIEDQTICSWGNVCSYTTMPVENILFGTTPLVITRVSSPLENKTYKIGDVIQITTTFNKNVYVTGNPRIQLETDTTDRYAVYSSGNGSNYLRFDYAIQQEDITADLDYTAVNSLELNGGTIKDIAGNDAGLALPLPGTTGSLGDSRDITIDGVLPSIQTSSVTDGQAGVAINQPITIIFSENVYSGTTYAGITVNQAVYDEVYGTQYIQIPITTNITGNTLTITPDTQLDQTTTYTVEIPAGAVEDEAGNSLPAQQDYTFTTGDFTAPTITGVVPGATYNGTVTPTFTEGTATLNGESYTLGTPITQNGTYTLAVTDTSGNTTTVTFTIYIPAANANLAGMTISAGTLSPAFSTSQTTYTTVVSSSTSTITVTPTAQDANAQIRVNGVTTPNGSESHTITLTTGENTITVQLTAEDTTTMKIYTITVTKQASTSYTPPPIIPPEPLPPPAPSIPSGTIIGSTNNTITLTIPEEAATVYFTLDGTEPTSSSTRYTGAITIDGTDGQTITLKAAAYDEKGNKGEVGTYTYTIDKTGPKAPTASQPEGEYKAGEKITITPAADAQETYYTINGSEPDKSDKKYTEPIELQGTDGQKITLKAVSYDEVGNRGEAIVQVYTIKSEETELEKLQKEEELQQQEQPKEQTKEIQQEPKETSAEQQNNKEKAIEEIVQQVLGGNSYILGSNNAVQGAGYSAETTQGNNNTVQTQLQTNEQTGLPQQSQDNKNNIIQADTNDMMVQGNNSGKNKAVLTKEEQEKRIRTVITTVAVGGAAAAGAAAVGVAIATGAMGAAAGAGAAGAVAVGVTGTAGAAAATGTAATAATATGATLIGNVMSAATSTTFDITRSAIGWIRRIKKYRKRILYKNYRRAEKLKRGITVDIDGIAELNEKQLKKSRFTFVRINTEISKMFEQTPDEGNMIGIEELAQAIERITKKLSVSLKIDFNQETIEKDEEYQRIILRQVESLAGYLNKYTASRLFIEIPYIPEITDRLTRAVRKEMPKHTIVLSGIEINKLLGMPRPKDRNMIYGYNITDSKVEIPRMKIVLKGVYRWSNTNKVPVVAEIQSMEDKKWLKKLKIMLKRYVMGWVLPDNWEAIDTMTAKTLKLKKKKNI